MKEIWNWTQAAIAAAGGGLGYFLGGWDGFLYAPSSTSIWSVRLAMRF